MSPLALYLSALNILTFALCLADKGAARRGGRRIPERVLFALAAAGGTAGLLVGMKLDRHKTKKSSFQFVLALILLVQLAAYAALRN